MHKTHKVKKKRTPTKQERNKTKINTRQNEAKIIDSYT